MKIENKFRQNRLKIKGKRVTWLSCKSGYFSFILPTIPNYIRPISQIDGKPLHSLS